MLWQRRRLLRRLRETPVEWYFSFDYEDDVPTYRAIVDGTTYKLRSHPPGAVGYTLLMHGKKIADIALTQWPPAWEIVGFGKRKNAGSLDAGPAVSAEQIRAWAEGLCRSSGGPAGMAAAMGLEGNLVDHAPLDYATIEPPPPGMTHFMLSQGSHGIDTVDMEFSNCVATRAELDSLLGEGVNLPAIHPTSTFKIGYRVEVPGAPHRCSVFVDFDYPDTPTSLPASIMFRRDPGSD